MRLSIDSFNPQHRFGDKGGLKIIRDAGFDCVDYTFCCLPEDHPLLGEGSADYAREIRAYLDEIGLLCNQAHAPFEKESTSPADLSCFPCPAMIRAMEAASILGAKTIVVHAVSLPGKSAREIEDYNYKYYKILEPYAEKFGIRIAVENLFNNDHKRQTFINRRCGTPELVNRMLTRLDSPWFTACVDLGHASITGFEPEEFLREVLPGSVTALHVQDTDYRGDLHQLPFICDLNWEGIMKTLKEIGYEGDFTYEINSYMRKFPSELYPSALALAHDVGRYLIKIYNEA